VLVGDFGPIARAGVRDLLLDLGLRPLSGDGARDLLAQVADLYPDAVVIDLDSGHATATAAEVSGRYPGVTIVACSAERPVMEVKPAWGGEPYTAIFSGPALVEAVGSRR
jgi:hypothetical protein